MKRISAWILSTISVLVLLFGYHESTSGALTVTPKSSVVATTTSTTTVGSSGTTTKKKSSSTKTSASSKKSTRSAATTTTVAGDTEQTQWGPTQVEITVTAGKITKVAMLQQTSGNPRDDQIDSYALPQLISETLSAQSSQISAISGATVTSDGYISSLQSAIDRAGI
jgi:uncharacterized protein with FMN-binding domain